MLDAHDTLETADTLIRRAAQGHEALMQGDLAGYRAQIDTTADFTLMAPFGGKPTEGSTLTDERWQQIGRFFAHGRNATWELVRAYPSADMVVLAGIERAFVEVGGLEGQDWSLRVTLVFRREGGEWRLAHRHADPLVAGITLEQAAALARNASAAAAS
jgi:ketosteroid isomerase-like protein